MNKIKNLTKQISAAVLATMMVTSMAMPVIAEEIPLANVTGSDTKVIKTTAAGTDISTADVITKNFIMRKDLATPTEEFNFTLTAITLADADNGTNGATQADGPELTVSKVDTAAADAGITGTITKTDDVITGFTKADTGDYKLVQKQTSILDKDGNTLTGTDFPHAGEYVYTLKETTGSDTSVDYSKAEYQIHIYVANTAANSDGNGTGTLYIAGISAVRMTNNDTAAATTDGDTKTKVDITGTTTNTYGDSTTDTDVSFQNLYFKTSQLEISKVVAGGYADQTKYFDYTVTLNVPNDRVSNKTAEYKAYVVDSTGAKVNAADNNSHPVEYTFTMSDYTKEVSNILLKHNQSLKFYDPDDDTKGVLPVGTDYVVKETGATDYIPSYQVKYNGETGFVAQKAAAVAASADLSSIKYVAGDTNTDHTVVGENFNNEIAFKNTYKTVTPTGIIINNLPYIMMILIALGAMFAFVVAKRKKRA